MSFFHKIKKIAVVKFVIKNEKPYGAGCMQRLARNVVNGHTIWADERIRIVLPYIILLFMGIFLITSACINLYLHGNDVQWFKNLLDIAFCTSIVLLSIVHTVNGEKMEKISVDIEKWWNYKYLEEKSLKIKSNAENWVKMVYTYVYNSMFVLSIAYTCAPFLKYYFNGMTRTADIMVVACVPEEPWVYFGIVIGFLAVQSSIVDLSYDVIFLLSVTIMEIAQIRMNGIAFMSINDRVLRLMKAYDINYANRKVYEKLIDNEIKSCVMHYQAIHSQIKMLYEVFVPSLNHFYYVGCMCFVALGVLLLKIDGINIFLIQILLAYSAQLSAQYIYCYINDSITDEVEKLRLTVVSSKWHVMPVKSQKSVHIMQTMLLNCPKFKTLFGTEVNTEFFGKVLNAGYYYITTILSADAN